MDSKAGNTNNALKEALFFLLDRKKKKKNPELRVTSLRSLIQKKFEPTSAQSQSLSELFPNTLPLILQPFLGEHLLRKETCNPNRPKQWGQS